MNGVRAVSANDAEATQLDLFGQIEQWEREHVAWAVRFERADWVAPYDTADGRPAGTVYHGWRCPDPDCGEIAPNAFLLRINHGWDPDLPGIQPRNNRCIKHATTWPVDTAQPTAL